MIADPYHRWLGISASAQPPNYYQLLGLTRYESDPEVIQNAAERQISHVRTVSDDSPAAATVLIRQIEGARDGLLNGPMKLAYDQHLRSPPDRRPVPPASSDVPRGGKAASSIRPLLLGGAVGAGAVGTIVLLWLLGLLGGGQAPSGAPDDGFQQPSATAKADIKGASPKTKPAPSSAAAPRPASGAIESVVDRIRKQFGTLRDFHAHQNSDGATRGEIRLITASHDGRLLATSANAEVKIWSMPAGELKATASVNNHLPRQNRVHCLSFTADGDLFIGSYQELYLMSSEDGSLESLSLTRRGVQSAVHFRQKPYRLEVGTDGPRVNDYRRGGDVVVFKKLDSNQSSMGGAISNDDRRFAAWRGERFILWELGSSTPQFERPVTDKPEAVLAAVFSRDGRRIHLMCRPAKAGVNLFPTLETWDLSTGERTHRVQLNFTATWMRVLPGETHALLLDFLGHLKLLDWKTGRVVALSDELGRMHHGSSAPWQFAAPDDFAWIAIAQPQGRVLLMGP